MPIKCNNCGWSNPDGALCCEKCNSTLSVVRAQSTFNPRATIADVNPRATMADVNPRATMADVNPRATVADVNPRATVADFNPRATVCEAPIASQREYRLLCLDDRAGNIVTLQSAIPLTLVDGEIILLGGLRYKVL